MATSFCKGCECGNEKSIPVPSFSACRTRHLGGIAGIIITCDGLGHSINANGNEVDFSGNETSISVDLFNYFNNHIDNDTPLIIAPFKDEEGATDDMGNDIPDGYNDLDIDPIYHYWCVDADLPTTEDELEELSFCGSESVIDRSHKIVGDILDVNTINYDMMRYYQALSKARVWFLTGSGQLYGGQQGISVSISRFNYVIPRATKEAQKISFEFKWRCLKQPERFDVSTWLLPNPGFI